MISCVYIVDSYRLVMPAWQQDRVMCQGSSTHQDSLMDQGGHRDLTTGVMDDFGKCESRMVFQD